MKLSIRCTRSTGAAVDAAVLRGMVPAVVLSVLLALAGCPKQQNGEVTADVPPPAPELEQPTLVTEADPVSDTTGMELEQFAGAIIDDYNSAWAGLFDEHGRSYSGPEVEWFNGAIDGVCDFEQPAAKPFYCPADSTLYLDSDFLAALREPDDSAADLAAAYAIAHHVGHHVQTVLGYTEEVENMRAGLTEEKSADLTLRYELQADFFAGMWMHHAGLLPAEVTEESVEALLAAVTAAVEEAGDSVDGAGSAAFAPDPLTHGTAEQRQYWLWRGYDTGDISYGSTFAADQL